MRDRENGDLLFAVRTGSMKKALEALNAGADIDTADQTPLIRACSAGQKDILEMLIMRGAKVETALSDMQMKSTSELSPLVRLLIAQKANINSVGQNGTALMNALKNDEPDVVKLLLDHQADPTLQDNTGETPLACAAGRPLHRLTNMHVRPRRGYGNSSVASHPVPIQSKDGKTSHELVYDAVERKKGAGF